MTPNCDVSTTGWSVCTNDKAVTPDEERTKKLLIQNNRKHLLYKPSWPPETVIAGLQAVFFSFIFSKVVEGPQTHALSDLEIKSSLWHNESKPPFCSARLTTMIERKADSRFEIVVVPHFSSEIVERAKCDAVEREKNFSLSPPRVAFSRVEWFSRALAFRSPYNGGLLVVYFWKKERCAKRANFT